MTEHRGRVRHERAPASAPGRSAGSPEDLREAILAASHELNERLTASNNYLATCLRLAERGPAAAPIGPRHMEILEKAAIQSGLAVSVARRLRQLLDEDTTKTPAGVASGPVYRVRFFNEFARGGAVARPCQRTIIIRSARSRERAVEAAKKRFARLEGIRDWRIHAQIVEVDTIEPR